MNKQVKEKKKLYHGYVAGLIATLLLLSITGCGSSYTSAVGSQKAKKIPIKIEDIEWSVDEEIVNGERALAFNYTNNTKYTIGDLLIEFTLKDGITDEELKVFDTIKEENDMTDEEIKDIDITGYSHKFADPQETVSGIVYCSVESSMAQYEVMQPDIATIVYIDNDKAYKIYYDFKSQKFSWGDENGIEIYQWAEGELANMIPKPNVPSVLCSENETGFGFTSYGASKDQFKEYVQACKDKGFTYDTSNSDTYYNAKNSEGYELSIHYFDRDEQLDGNLYAPDKKETPQPTENTVTQTSTSSANTEAWKQFLKDYENWANSYVELAKKCKENPDDLSLISDYSKIMTETVEWADKAQEYEDKLESDNVSSEVLTEYINTVARITQKITEIAE